MAERTQQLHLLEPLPGFPTEDEYTLAPIDDRGVLYSLRSVRDPDVRLVLTPAHTFFADYQPDADALLAATLGADDVQLFLVLTLGTGLQDATANLRAPIAVAASTARAVQVVLEDETLAMHEPLVRR